MSRSGALLTACAIVLAVLALPSVMGDHTPPRYLVGYEPGDEDAAHAAIKLAGGEIRRSSPELGFAVVEADNGDAFVQLISTSPSIHYVEVDDGTDLAGSQWNGSQWNGAQWNGAQWNGAQWNGGQWNGAQWNDAALEDVSEDQRLAAKWTEKHYQSDDTNKMKWAGDATDPGLVWQWASWATDANHAWTAGATGTRTAKLCVLDSGVAWDHPDIAPNYAAGYNAIDPSLSAYDDGGHGTHIAGIAAGSLADAFGISGVANVLILNAKVLDGEGRGHESDLAFGIVWCANQGADVAVMALSADAPGPTMDRALNYAAKRDVLMLASAGNGGPCTDCVAYPASDPRVLAVGAVDGNLHLAPFSSSGPEVDFAAPGVYLIGPFPGDMFVFGSGTSQAVAHAAGIAALVRDVRPDLTAEQATAALVAGTTDLGDIGRDASYGHGLLDVRLAVAAAQDA